MSQSSEMTLEEEAHARKAELIRKVREGTPPLWTPKSGWADEFTDDEIWEAWRVCARDPQLSATPMMVAATLVCDVIDGNHR